MQGVDCSRHDTISVLTVTTLLKQISNLLSSLRQRAMSDMSEFGVVDTVSESQTQITVVNQIIHIKCMSIEALTSTIFALFAVKAGTWGTYVHLRMIHPYAGNIWTFPMELQENRFWILAVLTGAKNRWESASRARCVIPRLWIPDFQISVYTSQHPNIADTIPNREAIHAHLSSQASYVSQTEVLQAVCTVEWNRQHVQGYSAPQPSIPLTCWT